MRGVVPNQMAWLVDRALPRCGAPHTAAESVADAQSLGIEIRWLPRATPELGVEWAARSGVHETDDEGPQTLRTVAAEAHRDTLEPPARRLSGVSVCCVGRKRVQGLRLLYANSLGYLT